MSSSDDAATLQSIGHDTVQYFVAVTVETFLVAIYSVLVFQTSFLLMRKRRTRVSVYTCLAVFVMFGMALSLWMIDIHNVIIEVQGTLLSTAPDSLDDLYNIALGRVVQLSSVEDVLYAFMTNVGDGIIIWRVYAFWSKGLERLAFFVTLAFLFGSTTTSILITYCAAHVGADIELGAFRHPAFCRNIQTASYAMTFATTGVATLLIAYKTWCYRRTHIEAFGTLSRLTRAQKIMVMLVESGILYMLFFLVQVVGSLASVNDSINKHPTIAFGFTIYDFMTSCIVGMYPTVVVILVHSKHSVLRSEAETSTMAGGGIAFKSFGATQTSAPSTYAHSASSAPALATRPPATAVDLYEMSRLSDAERGDAKEAALEVKVQRTVSGAQDV
ncbi:hypothetical protein BD413DRAFT_656267 [Trametes elegans]|nr:hypothetical protein BD413DRAFT_656267 [Trametes elegans]